MMTDERRPPKGESFAKRWKHVILCWRGLVLHCCYFVTIDSRRSRAITPAEGGVNPKSSKMGTMRVYYPCRFGRKVVRNRDGIA
jgi:hypothetical protein